MTATTTTLPLTDLYALHEPMRVELERAFLRVLRESHFTNGPDVEAFEDELGAFLRAPYVVGVASGTAALTLMLTAAGIGHGDEVILPPNTFFATAEAVVASGARPVLADVEPATALLDPAAVAAAVTPRTAAILAVHLYGQPVDADRLGDVARRHGILLLEDGCQALGGHWAGRPVGTLGHAAAFSFYPSKNLGALGDGGAVVTDDPEIARVVRLLRSHGEVIRHQHECWGACERLDALQAAFLRVKLEHLPEHQRQRCATARLYRERLAPLAGIRGLHTSPDAGHAHHLFVVTTHDRDRVLDELHHEGIEAAVHYPRPIHLQPGARGLGEPGRFPAAEHLARTVLSLPFWPGMPEPHVDRVVGALAGITGRVAA
jgi:dTDP-3-amino-3,4,6-trideoxy-alpha-D-glucose transaminase